MELVGQVYGRRQTLGLPAGHGPGREELHNRHDAGADDDGDERRLDQCETTATGSCVWREWKLSPHTERMYNSGRKRASGIVKMAKSGNDGIG